MCIENAPAMHDVKEIGLWDRGAYAKVIALILRNHVQFYALKTMALLKKVNAI
jgi:hypothetical protein